MSLFEEIVHKYGEKTFLFSRLKDNKQKEKEQSVKNSLCNSLSHEPSRNEMEVCMEEFGQQFQILKIEKAQEVAEKYLKSGRPVKSLMKEIQADLEKQIYNIITNTRGSLEKSIKNRNMESTAGLTNTNSHDSLLHVPEQTAKKVTSITQTPKIIEFTLGNRNSSPNADNSSKTDSDVSEFLLAHKASGSRVIKEKVMKGNNNEMKGREGKWKQQ